MTFNYRVILRTISVVILLEGLAMLIPMAYGMHEEETEAASALFMISLCCCTLGLLVYRFLHYYTLKIKQRESYFVAFLCWGISSIVGVLPYYLSGCGFSLIDCFFESVSGWTTTGASAIPLDEMPRCLILWKAITNWLGGMGLLVLTVSLFPILGIDGQKMAAAEMPGPEVEKMSARISDTAKFSYKIYIVMTVVEFLLLIFGSNIPTFEVVINTLSTISTAGMLNVQGNVMGNLTPYVKTVLLFFSVFGSINFMMYFYLFKRKWRNVLKNIELRTYLGLLAGGSVIIAVSLLYNGLYQNPLEALQDALTQSVAFGATSGFEITNINLWPTVAKLILICLIFIGGCANSTGGSIKVIRFIIFFKLILRGIYKRIHPRSVKPIMIQGKPVSAGTASNVTVFMMLYFAIFVLSSIVLSLENLDMETTFSTVLACMSNNGTGFGSIAGGNFTMLSGFGKLYTSVLMLAGRLELFAIVIMFSRSFWNSDRARS